VHHFRCCMSIDGLFEAAGATYTALEPLLAALSTDLGFNLDRHPTAAAVTALHNTGRPVVIHTTDASDSLDQGDSSESAERAAMMVALQRGDWQEKSPPASPINDRKASTAASHAKKTVSETPSRSNLEVPALQGGAARRHSDGDIVRQAVNKAVAAPLMSDNLQGHASTTSGNRPASSEPTFGSAVTLPLPPPPLPPRSPRVPRRATEGSLSVERGPQAPILPAGGSPAVSPRVPRRTEHGESLVTAPTSQQAPSDNNTSQRPPLQRMTTDEDMDMPLPEPPAPVLNAVAEDSCGP
jgi:hypothetical protein